MIIKELEKVLDDLQEELLAQEKVAIKKMGSRKFKKAVQKLSHTVGFTGVGPTLLDTEPKRPPVRLMPGEELVIPCIETIKKMRQVGWRLSCIETLGEDPDEDWM